jgi:hypothetical protein
MLILQLGIQQFLIFVPADWGGVNSDGDWVSAREHWSALIAFGLTLAIFILVDKYQKLKEKLDSSNK